MKRLSLQIPFAQTFVLNYQGDERRWRSFLEENGWGQDAGRFVRVPTLDPYKVVKPRGWRGTQLQWSLLRSQQSVFEYCLNQNIPSAMILTDDARLVKDSQAIQENFANELPIDWRLLLLGGEHRHLDSGVPAMVSESVFRPYSISSPCAFGWRGFPMLREQYDFTIVSCSNRLGSRDYSAVRRIRSRAIYVPGQWMFQSSMFDRNQDAAEISEPFQETVVAVLGAFRGGTSCVGGVLNSLGVPMGSTLLQPDEMNPTGYFECVELHRICSRTFDYPSMAKLIPQIQTTGLLRRWARKQIEMGSNINMLGAKHPSLCCLGTEMQIAWPNCKFIVVDRPVSAIVDSILRTTWGWNREEAMLNTTTVLEQREEFLKNCSIDQYLRVDFNALRDNPKLQVIRLSRWLSLPIDAERIACAVGHVA